MIGNNTNANANDILENDLDDDIEENIIKPTSIELKIIVIGNSATGKTSFCRRWVYNTFSDNCKATLMTEFSFKMYNYKEKLYKVQIWDIAGQDRSIHLSKIFSNNSHGVIIMTDVCNQDSLEASKKWKSEIENTILFPDGKNVPILLLRNKVDLLEEDKNDSSETLLKYAKENNYIGAFFTSAKTNYNVNEAMNFFIRNIADRLEEYNKANPDKDNDEEKRRSITLNKVNNNVNSNKSLENSNSGCAC